MCYGSINSYMLEIMNQLHIYFWGKVIENLGCGAGYVAWSAMPCLAKLLRKLKNLNDLPILEEKG